MPSPHAWFRPTGFLFGASAERLAEFVLGSFAFVTPVPYQIDDGHDFHRVLHRSARAGLLGAREVG